MSDFPEVPPRKRAAPLKRYSPAEQVERDQAALMYQLRVAGKTQSEIARIFGCSTARVFKRLHHQDLQEIYETARQVILQRLVPQSLEVMEEKIVQERDGDMARDVIFGVGLLSKNVKVSATVGGAEETFDDWRRERLRAALQATPAQAALSDSDEILEADIRAAEEPPLEGPSTN